MKLIRLVIPCCRLPLAACRLPLAACILLFSPLNLAQTDTVVTTEDVADAAEEEDDDIEEVVVTGSRIRRDAFSSAAPVQIIQGAISREVGLIDTAALISSTTQAAGAQIDSTFTGFVLDNGPGSSQVNLRGLGSGRTLVLLNSRRVASAGVGGAPTSADTSLMPGIMIDRIEFLLDGASSVYGSDAVAGVVNVIMRTDFEGFDFEAQINQPTESGGGQGTFGLAWGGGGDRWNIGIGAEYYKRQVLKLSDRSFTSQCERWLYADEDGRRLSNDLSNHPGTAESPCTLRLINRVFLGGRGLFGSVYSTPGFTNIGIPGWSDSTLPTAWAGFNSTIDPVTGVIDPDGDGLSDIDFQAQPYQFNGSDVDRSSNFLSPTERISLYAYGNYDLENESNTSLYFEALYSRRETDYFFASASIFPDVPDSNPYNPCGATARANGQNCRAFLNETGRLALDPVPQEALPIVIIRGDRSTNDIKIQQLQVTGGIKGDLLSWQNDSGFGNWGYDFYVSHSTSEGKDRLEGILEAELLHSLETSAIHSDTGEVVCGVDADMDGNPDGTDPWGNSCVPINMFAESIYQSGGGDFATQAERDYLFGVRGFDATEVKQTVVSGIIQGDLFNLPWNNTSVDLVLGLEYRKDEIDSNPNEAAREGLFYGFFSDRGAKGSRSLQELFFETELQLLQDVRFADELRLNLAARYTDESSYGSDITYSTKLFYRPNSIVTLRATYGTSFRAPNAREQFLLGTSGFNTIYDPCVVPQDARVAGADADGPAVYDATEDQRTPVTLDNCRTAGIDPTMLGLVDGGATSYSVEVFTKGGDHVQANIDPETSTSKTYGIVLDVPYWDELTLRFGMTYYEITVVDNITRRSAGGVVFNCYVESEAHLCDQIIRDEDGLLSEVDSSYININEVASHGIDYNLYAERDFILSNDRNFNVALDITTSRLIENKYTFPTFVEDDARTPYAPEWDANISLILTYRDFRFIWYTNYVSSEDEYIAYEDVTDNGYEEWADPCYGLTYDSGPRSGDRVKCRPYLKTPNYMTHSMSFSWQPQDWSFTLGLNNLFDKEPPLLDDDVPETQRNNYPAGAGYDILGRRVFLSVRRSL